MDAARMIFKHEEQDEELVPRLVKSRRDEGFVEQDLERIERIPVKRSAEDDRIEGSIRMVKHDRGFLFIAGDDGRDHFAHWSSFEKTSKGFRETEVQDRVSFISIEGPKGPRAIQVRVIG